MSHEPEDGEVIDLEERPSHANPLRWIDVNLYKEESRDSSSPGSSAGLQAGGSHEKRVDHGKNHHHAKPPVYKRRTEANSTELFFDLFFVANLTVFTNRHEIDSGDSLRSYVLFFSILWFTWLQVTLFDARFSADSVFERICKALHFGVMTGFAVVGPNFNATDNSFAVEQQLTLILLASRVILIVQYTTVLTYTRKQTEALIPLVLQAVTLAISSAIFIGIYFSFTEANGSKGQIGWIVVSVVEALSLFAISSSWTSFSFRHSCLPQRVTLLTLIILGEGIIGFAEALAKIANTVASTDILSGVAISSVLITYFLFLLYFDQIAIDRFGTVRQHIWAIVHYPLHLTFLLTLQGVNQLALFSVALRQIQIVIQPINDAINSPNDVSNATFASTTNTTVDQFAINSGYIGDNIPESINSTLADIVKGNATDPELEELIPKIATYVFSTYGYLIKSENTEGLQEVLDSVSTAYLYFFIAAGSALLILACLLLIGKRHKSAAEYSSVVVRVAVGTGICLSTLVDLPSQSDNFSNFLGSGWTLPMMMLALGLVLVLDVLWVKIFRAKSVHQVLKKGADF